MNLDARSDSSSFFPPPPPPPCPSKCTYPLSRPSVDDARIIIIGWTSTTYQMQAAAAAVGGRGLNMPRGAAVKPVSRLQGTKQTHTGSRHGCHISLSSPVAPPRAAGRGNLAMPREREAGGSCSRARDNHEQHEWTRTASAAFARPRQQHNSICPPLGGGELYQTWTRGGRLEKLKDSLKLLRLEHFSQSRSERLRLASSSGSGEFDLPSGKAAEFLAAWPFLTLPD